MRLIDADELLKKLNEISHYDDHDVLVVDWDDMIICIDNVTKMNEVDEAPTIVKQYCRASGEMCELATDFGYCKLTSCFKKSYSGQCLQTTYRYGYCFAKMDEVEL